MGGLGEDLIEAGEDFSSEAGGLEGDVEDVDEESGGNRSQQSGQAATVSFRVITSPPLRLLARDLRRLGPAVVQELNKGLRMYAEDLAQQAKQRARGMPRVGPGPDRLWNSIRVKGATGSIRVVGGGSGAPEFAPIDNGGRPGSFRHPVFGNRAVWVSQRAYPILEPSADELRAADKIALDAIDRALRRTGFA